MTENVVDGSGARLRPDADACRCTRFCKSAKTFVAPSTDCRTDQVWQRVGASATIGFHALHIAGATDRLLTYARGEQLSAVQVAAAREESRLSGLDAAALDARVEHAMEAALEQIRRTPVSTLTAPRDVGRDHLPSTVIGLLFHAAEHAARHAGQMATLRRIAGQL